MNEKFWCTLQFVSHMFLCSSEQHCRITHSLPFCSWILTFKFELQIFASQLMLQLFVTKMFIVFPSVVFVTARLLTRIKEFLKTFFDKKKKHIIVFNQYIKKVSNLIINKIAAERGPGVPRTTVADCPKMAPNWFQIENLFGSQSSVCPKREQLAKSRQIISSQTN